MKKIFLLSILLGLSVSQGFSQKARVLYFKADLGCCQATACNALEKDIREIIEKHYGTPAVVFQVVRIADTENQAMVAQYKAGSQSVIFVAQNGGKELATDVSDTVRKYVRHRDKNKLEQELLAEMKKVLK
jgi:hypothetical protein